MNISKKLLLVEGWRGINHSFALVNQFQLLELAKRNDIEIQHIDAPFYYPHWNKSTNSVGFSDKDELTINSIPSAQSGTHPDLIYRCFSPIDLRPPKTSGRLCVFIVTELGLDAKNFAEGSDISLFEKEGGVVVTPSTWSRDRVIDAGFSENNVYVVPHGASPEYFFPNPQEVIQQQRKALGFQSNEIILLNIGAALWNKGVDILLTAFAEARKTRKDIRLLFKDQRNTYGISGENYVQQTLKDAHLLSEDVLNAITLIPSNLNMMQMNGLYNIADCYVTPYRAEGFNLPALEAMACGTPVIATAGGATEDFINEPGCQKIESVLQKNTVIQNTKIGAYCEPNRDHLIQLLLSQGLKNGSQNLPDPRKVINWSNASYSLAKLAGC